MTRHADRRAGEIRRALDHPIIDGDGHVLEYLPTLWELMAEEGGPAVADRFRTPTPARWYGLSPDQRRSRREVRPGFWNWPSENVVDFATACFPALLEERRQELGIDFSFVYPSFGIQVPHVADEASRIPGCRAVNRYMAELFGPYEATICPVGVVPMHTPAEALDGLEHGTRLGLRAFVFPGNVRREADGGAWWIDTYGLDSDFDYDPVWQRCQELGVVVAFHSGSTAWTSRRSISNYVYNHIGHFANANDTTAKSLLLGGVTARFPDLRFVFLEGGVAWACSLLGAVVEHWEKRNGGAVWAYDPSRFDRARFGELLDRYGPDRLRRRRAELADACAGWWLAEESPDGVDDFGRVEVSRPGDFIRRFVEPFAFGCEADDVLAAWAFQERYVPLGRRLSAVFSSDIGHWDVPDATGVVPEAYEMVTDGLLTAEQFRAFTFGNIARHYTAMDPDFFAKTVIGQAVADDRRA
ncbi:MAG TPA: amidohydrolase family protein [Acidimicrobiia bacterium]|nr:amidohydrolase family protein [Acidimicrobiia bacterium]